MRRYYNREAVVISALQVEKHPVTMPGPFATPPAQRHLFHSNSSVFQMTPPSRRFDPMLSRTASPAPGRLGSIVSGLYGSPRYSPKPHSSPKMKLRLTDLYEIDLPLFAFQTSFVSASALISIGLFFIVCTLVMSKEVCVLFRIN